MRSLSIAHFLLSALLPHATATYISDYSPPSVPAVSPLYLSPTFTTSTESVFYPYPTSSVQNISSSCHHSTAPHHPPPGSTYISGIVHGTGSGYPLPSASGNGTGYGDGNGNSTYHAPALSTPQTSISTTVLSTTSPGSNISTSASTPASASSGTTQDTTTSQSASPTQSEPAEPMFTGSALRLPELQVWKWNVGVSVGLGVMVMWI
ncbi:hypothetical protein K458DRAFT_422289 [Lentithecium fluviatile CBS 122367]|uniref:Uncharacterized protein n=1 Tax=Lentithecium fluviatile CBS 122367 TaxID=1168545 RepID=A0A6G1IML0_9PLEO|nr:hypothetical protein K458DRAFT_422289 [Lentithecium fluviatile CBS 122367]